MSNENKEVAKVNPLKKLDVEIAEAKTVKDLLKINLISNRYIANYESGTGRKDGKERYEREAFAFMELANARPEIMECEKVSIFAGFIKAGLTGLSFSSNKLSVYTRNVKSGKTPEGQDMWKKFLVVDPDAHGKKEMLERMPTIKKINEGVIVFVKDEFQYDAKNKKVVKHVQNWPVPEASETTVIGVYSTVEYTDSTTKEFILSLAELKRAREKSTNVTYKEVEGQKQKVKDGGELWNKHYGEACKKSVYNRIYKIEYKQPETAILFKQYEPEDETTDTTFSEVVQEETSFDEVAKAESSQQGTAETVGEVIAIEEVKEEPKKPAKPKREVPEF